MTDLAVRKLRPWDERVGLDASVTNVAKGKRSINRGVDKQTSMIPLPVGGEAKFYSSGHSDSYLLTNNPKSKNFKNDTFTLPNIDGNRGVWLTFRQTLAGENLRGTGPKVYYQRHDFHNVRDHLVEGFYRNLAREQVKAAELADELRLERIETFKRQEKHTEECFKRLLENTKTRGFEGTKRPPVRTSAENDKKNFAKSLKGPDCTVSKMERWSEKVIF